MIKQFEELSINAWPALQNMLYDGWLLRLSNGYTKRANSINPINSTSIDTMEKIKFCEDIYESHGIDVVYKITDAVIPNNLDLILENLNYKKDSPTSVQTLELDKSFISDFSNITITEEISEEWLSSFIKFTKVSERNSLALEKMLRNIIPKTYYAALKNDNKIIACGLGVMQKDFVGLFDIVVDEAYRNNGYGRQVVLSLLDKGLRNGADKAYLQVMLNNAPALNLYSSIGFKEIYQYWYRIK